MDSPLARRLRQAMAQAPTRVTKADLARAAGVKQPSVTDWFNGKTQRLGSKTLIPVARVLGVNPEWLNDGKLPMRPSEPRSVGLRVREELPAPSSDFEIHVIDSPGSCGNGRDGVGNVPRSIVMPAQWFKSRGLKADDLVAVIADGDANADYIAHGDVVIFDKTKRKPESGKIFLVHHPDGLKIRRLRLAVDGSWVLEYLGNDKARWPDDRIPPERIDLLKIEGQFVYRQGG